MANIWTFGINNPKLPSTASWYILFFYFISPYFLYFQKQYIFKCSKWILKRSNTTKKHRYQNANWKVIPASRRRRRSCCSCSRHHTRFPGSFDSISGLPDTLWFSTPAHYYAPHLKNIITHQHPIPVCCFNSSSRFHT